MGAFFVQVILLSLSGVMAPGPVTAVALERGKYSPSAGLFIAIGHGIIEIPLMILLYWGIGHIFHIPLVQDSIYLFGGLFLLLMAWQVAKNIHRPVDKPPQSLSGSNIRSGILLSLANPHFFVWWATIGTALILQAFDYGLMYFLIFVLVHWGCDILWLLFVSFFSHKTHRTFGYRFRVVLSSACFLLLMGFGAFFLVQFGRSVASLL